MTTRPDVPSTVDEPAEREPLSRQRILERAIAIADEGGVTALSMRKLATALGYEVMSLYNHVANKDDLLDAMLDEIYGELPPIPDDVGDFRLLDRRVVDAICAMPERNRFMKGLYGWVGFDSVAVPVELKERETGRSKFGFANLARLAITGVTSFTAWPLRVWTAIGSTIALVSLSYGVWIALRTLVFGVDVPGWSTLVVGTLFLGGVQLISIGVLGEYVARIYTEVKGRPGYIVAAETSANQEG